MFWVHLGEVLITAARLSIVVELPNFPAYVRDTKVIWKILLLLWEKLLSSHLVVDFADRDNSRMQAAVGLR